MDNKIDKKAQLFADVQQYLNTGVLPSATGQLISVTPASAFVSKQSDDIFDWPARLIYDDFDLRPASRALNCAARPSSVWVAPSRKTTFSYVFLKNKSV